jgi:hypothetical protein
MSLETIDDFETTVDDASHDMPVSDGTVRTEPAAAEPAAAAVSAESTEDSADEPEAEGALDQDRDNYGRFRPKHRAKSKEASAEDVPRIQKLTKQWRETEALVKTRDQELADLRAEVAALKASRQTVTPAAFDEQEPTLDQFMDKDDPYLAHARALAAYDRRKEAAEQAQTQHTESTAKETDARVTAIKQGYTTRATEFAKTHPDFNEVINSTGDQPGMDTAPVLSVAILTDDRGPEFVYHLAKSPALYAEMLLVADGKAVTDQSVALMRRVLAARVPAVSARSAAPATIGVSPPKPPNLARTGGSRLSDEPPTDSESLDDHLSRFESRGRRRY